MSLSCVRSYNWTIARLATPNGEITRGQFRDGPVSNNRIYRHFPTIGTKSKTRELLKMNLYKYVGFDACERIFENMTMAFSTPEFFNDPFECSTLLTPPDDEPLLVEVLLGPVRRWAKTHIVKNNYAILSLTRAPLNPLMWSHYANCHRGFVVEIDPRKCGLTSLDTNTIPAQFGSVIYSMTKPPASVLGDFGPGFNLGGTAQFQCDNLEKLQRYFLHKPLCWSYEEEVRVVKCISGDDFQTKSGILDCITGGAKPLYRIKIPIDGIRSIYLGLRNPLLESHADFEKFLMKIRVVCPDIAVLTCRIDDVSWNLIADVVDATPS